MDAHRYKIFAFGTMMSFLALSVAWVAVDSMANLDEILATATPGQSWSLWLVHYRGLVGVRGAQLIGAVALGSVAFGALACWRSQRFSSRTTG